LIAVDFTPSAGKIYTLGFNGIYLESDVIAVKDGKNFLGNFKVADGNWGLIASGNDLVVATAAEAKNACEAAGNTYADGVCESSEPAPIRTPQIASTQISVRVIGNAIMMENLPQNARVEIYNLEGKRLRSNNPENLKILRIMVQTKGIYIVKINNNVMRIAVR
jgi:hypothetical protein